MLNKLLKARIFTLVDAHDTILECSQPDDDIQNTLVWKTLA